MTSRKSVVFVGEGKNAIPGPCLQLMLLPEAQGEEVLVLQLGELFEDMCSL